LALSQVTVARGFSGVSTPKQKLEHQREHVVRYCEQAGIDVPPDFRFEDKKKRHKSDKRRDFQRLRDASGTVC